MKSTTQQEPVSLQARLTKEPDPTGARPKMEEPTTTGVGFGDGRHTI